MCSAMLHGLFVGVVGAKGTQNFPRRRSNKILHIAVSSNLINLIEFDSKWKKLENIF